MVSVFDAKSNLSKLIQLANQGDEVIITNRGQQVAQLVPVKKPQGVTLGLFQDSFPDWDPDSVDISADFEEQP